MFISCLRTEKWSLVSAPLLKKKGVAARPAAGEAGHFDPRRGKPQKQRLAAVPLEPRIHPPRPTVPEELQTDRKKTWEELHSPDAIAEARRRFMGTSSPYRGN